MKTFRENITKFNKKLQSGGGKKHKYDDDLLDDSDSNSDSDSDSDLLDDSDSDFYPLYTSGNIRAHPLTYWWYDPYVFRIKKYYLPTFIAPLAPYVQIPLYLN